MNFMMMISVLKENIIKSRKEMQENKQWEQINPLKKTKQKQKQEPRMYPFVILNGSVFKRLHFSLSPIGL